MSAVMLGMPPAADLAARGRAPARRRDVPGRGPARLADTQLRANLGNATRTIRAKRAAVVAELPDWEELREAGRQLKVHTMAHLPDYLAQLEAAVTARGGVVHWARDAAEANRIVIDLVQATGADEVVKVKSMATQEIGLNEALEAAGIAALGDRPGRADRAARPRQAVAHPGAGDPPQPGRDPGDLPREMARRRPRPDRRPGRAGRRGAAAPAAQVPVRQGRDQRGQLRRRRDRHARRGRVRGQRPDVPDPAGDADHGDGHREAGAPLRATSRCSCSCCRGPRPASG